MTATHQGANMCHYEQQGKGRARGLILGIALGIASAHGGLAHAQVAQQPLFLGEKAEPNVVFSIDESWSMAWGYMPDEVKEGGKSIYGNPWATGPGDSGDSTGNRWTLAFHPDDVSTGGKRLDDSNSNDRNSGDGDTRTIPARAGNNGVATDLISARLRSSAFNSIYYDPEVRYHPWYNSDGTAFPDSNPAAAWLHPNNRNNTNVVNLKGAQTFNGKTWCKSLNNNTANSTSTSNRAYDTTRNTASCDKINGEKLAPAVYYTYNGQGFDKASNFTRVRIMDHATFTRGPGRTDCSAIAGSVGNTGGTCSQEEEYRNFANWFTYNRTRMFLAIAGTSRAFSEQGSGLRVGYGRLHQGNKSLDGESSPGTMERGVRRFSGADREAFFTWLHNLGGQLNNPSNPGNNNRRSLYGTAGTDHRFAGGTPLRTAMDDVGQYYSRTDNRGPWGNTPGTNDTSSQLACRKSYHILMTDGMWTTSGSTQSNATARTSGARNNVDDSNGPTITGPGGQSFQYTRAAPYRDNSSNTLADVAMYYWNRDLHPTLANTVPPDADNPAFWQNMVNFTVGLGVSGTLDYPGDWAALQAGTRSWPSVTANTSSAIDDLWHAAVNSRGSYLSATNPEEYASGLSAILRSVAAREGSSASSIATNSTRLDSGSLIYQASFDSKDWSGRMRAFRPDETTGQINENTPVWDTNTTLARNSTRTIFTKGSLFTWSRLSAAQKTALGPQDLLNWLHGSAALEGTTYRTRTRILGDIVNSDPFFVGQSEDYGYRNLPGSEGSSYGSFLTTVKAARDPLVYVGANDGMLHAFHAETGAEKFAYIPEALLPDLRHLADPSYVGQHRYYVDGAPRAGDAYINGWKTVLIGSTGAGGRTLYALDVTNGTADGSSVLWELTDTVDSNPLGIALGQPTIARVDSGDSWVGIFGNGYFESTETTVGNLKLMVVNLEDGDLIQAIDTGVSAVGNGLSSVTPVDVDNDRITDYVYAGDLQGNLWRFDLTSATSSSWSAHRVFQARDSATPPAAQPITVRPEVGRHPSGGLMIYFGTGKYFQTGDNIVANNPPVQTFYGIRDDLTSTQVTKANLLTQSIVYEDTPTLQTGSTSQKVRVVSANQPTASHKGWQLDLRPPSPASAQGERSVSMPVLRHGRIIFSTIIPNNDPCSYGGESWLMELDALSGGRLATSVFDLNNDMLIDSGDYVRLPTGEYVPVSGLYNDEMIKTPGIISAGELEYKYTSGSSGSIGIVREKGQLEILGRQSWRQLQ